MLALENLSIQLTNGQTLVDQVSFQIHQGEIFTLVGESGSGKSLTALAIMRLLPNVMRAEGRVCLEESDLLTLPEAQMRAVRGGRIGMIFQEPMTALNPLMRVGEQIAEVLKLHCQLSYKEQQQRVLSLLNEVGIPDADERMSWYPHQLSGGQKQRIMIAMALAGEPELLIADEPTTALDVTIQAQVLQLLLSIQKKRQLSILFITHDMGLVAQLADRVGVMYKGKLLEVLPVDAFFKTAHHDYTKQLIAHSLPTSTFKAPVAAQAEIVLSTDELTVTFAGRRRGLLFKKLADTQAVKAVSLQLKKGETLALVGESGCGKTTLAQALLRLVPAKGRVVFAQQSLLDLSERQMRPLRKQLQVVFQDPFGAFNPRMTIGKIIREGMDSLQVGLPNERDARVLELLELVGLRADQVNRYPHEFSGGQRQRIGIARALAVEPSLIICDEPTSALDVMVRGQILSLLEDLQQRMGVSYLFITHDLSIVPRIAHRVAVMRAGEIVESGSTEQVLLHPQSDYTKTLLASAPHQYLQQKLA